MSRVMSIRFQDDQIARLGRVSRLGKRPSETITLLVEEALRMAEHPQIDFRDSMAGGQAYVKGSGLAVWEVALIARLCGGDAARVASLCGGDAARVASYLHWPETRVRAALTYARDCSDEIGAAIDFASLQRLLPQIQALTVPASAFA